MNAVAPFFELGDLGPGAALLAAVAIGIAFGWTLERAGLGSAPKLAGQFYFADLTARVPAVETTALLTHDSQR